MRKARTEYGREDARILKNIGGNIRKMRHEVGLSQEDMQDYDISLRHYQRIECGQINPTALVLIKIAKAFKCDVKDFL